MKLGFICFSFFLLFFDSLEKRAQETTRRGNIAAEIKMYLKGLNERQGQSIKVLAVRRRRRRKEGK